MITKIVENRGDKTTASSNGKITLNQTTGEIIIRKSGVEVLRLDETGFKYYDSQSVLRISMGQNEQGQEQIIVYGADGKAQILMGQKPSSGAPILAIAEPGRDVIQDLA